MRLLAVERHAYVVRETSAASEHTCNKKAMKRLYGAYNTPVACLLVTPFACLCLLDEDTSLLARPPLRLEKSTPTKEACDIEFLHGKFIRHHATRAETLGLR